MNDPAFRVLGFFIGVSVIVALWINARVFRYKAPLISLALFALSPSVIRWGDSLRAYGLGIVAILCTVALIWRYIESPTVGRFIAATGVALISVHLLYYNAVLLFGFVVAAIVVCVHRRAWSQTRYVLLIGVIPAVTMLPYLAVNRSAKDWLPLVQIPSYTFGWFIAKLYETLDPGGPWSLALWLDSVALALLIAASIILKRGNRTAPEARYDKTLFAVVALSVGIIGSGLFLRKLSFLTQPWYYLTLLACAALSTDILLGIGLRRKSARVAKLIAAVAVSAATFYVGRTAVTERLTSVDRVTRTLGVSATASDLIVVTPWYYGVSFQRYYSGPTPWVTLPDMNFHRFHRFDIVKTAMQASNQLDPIKPAIDSARATLTRGGRIFLVGEPRVPEDSEDVDLPGPAPTPSGRWPEPAYSIQWSLAFSQYIKRHSVRFRVLVPRSATPVSHYENFVVLVAEGWRP
jgi:hypothetical protein